MGVRVRLAIAAALSGVTLMGAPIAPVIVPSLAGSLRAVSASGVVAYVPSAWDARPLPSEVPTISGIQASGNLDRWSNATGRVTGVEAYWLDATQVGVPSDYYRHVASGPALSSLPEHEGCRAEHRRVWSGAGSSTIPEAGDYLATATGVCRSGESSTRWGAFVAAPGFGPVREMGIPRSGLYYAFVAVREGPQSNERLDRILTSVSFGGTPVEEFLNAVGATSGVA
jgi:hypothetical protein